MHTHVLSLLLAALVPSLAAQNAPAPADKPAAKAPFVFEPGVVDVRTLIQRCGTYLQRNILVDDAELLPNKKREAPIDAPSIELQLPVVTDRDGCEDMLCSLLWTRGLVVVPLDEAKGVYEVLSVYGQRAREIWSRSVQRTPEQVLARPTLRQSVTVVYALKHVNATIATNALRPFFASGGNQNAIAGLVIGNVGNSTSILLTGMQDQVVNALQLLQAADVPQPPDAKPDLEQRVDVLTRQVEHLLQRVAALEEARKEK